MRGGGCGALLFTASGGFARLIWVCVSGMLACASASAQTGLPNAAVSKPAHANTEAALAWSEQEKRAIARHGPWPQPVLVDRSNRVSGSADAIALGRALFFDLRLSPKGDMACASCHQPGRALSDGRDRAHGRERLDRNTPGLWNAGLGRWFGWDGGADSLWGFALRPMLNPLELGASASHVAALLRDARCFADRFRGSAITRLISMTPAGVRES